MAVSIDDLRRSFYRYGDRRNYKQCSDALRFDAMVNMQCYISCSHFPPGKIIIISLMMGLDP